MVNEWLGSRHTIVRTLRQDFEKSPPSAQQHERFIHADARQPTREPRLFLKGAEVKESFVKTVLGHIFGILSVIRYPLRYGKNSLLVTKNQFLESARISALCGSDQRTVRVSVYTRSTRRFHESEPPPPLRQTVRETNYRASHSAYRMDWNIVH